MTGTADDGPGHPLETSEAQRYFRAVEEAFLSLRGTPLLLSPADWRVAKRWFEAGVPVDLVRDTMAELFEKRRERNPEARINSLRYFARAVDGAWKSLQELRGPDFPPAAETSAVARIDLDERLADLADRLPEALPERDRWRERIASLSGSLREVEEELGRLDTALLEAVARDLPSAKRAAIDREVEAAIARFGADHPDEELDNLRRQLLRQRLRQTESLPLLTLFG